MARAVIGDWGAVSGGYNPVGCGQGRTAWVGRADRHPKEAAGEGPPPPPPLNHVLEERGGGGFVFQKWPNQIFPPVNFFFSHDGQFGLGGPGGGGGVTPPPPAVISRSNTSLA